MLSIYTKNGYIPLSGIQNVSIKTEYGGNQILSFDILTNDKMYKHIQNHSTIRYLDNDFLVDSVNQRMKLTSITAKLDMHDWEKRIYQDFHVDNKLFSEIVMLITPSNWKIEDAGMVSGRQTITLEGISDHDILEECKSLFNIAYEYHIKDKCIKVIKPDSIQSRGLYATEELNATEIEYKGSTQTFATRLYAYGKKSEIKDENGNVISTSYVNFAEINNGKEFIDNNVYSDMIISCYWQDDSYTDSRDLLNDAIKKLNILAKPEQSYKFNLIDLSRVDEKYKMLDLKMYDKITLIIKNARVEHQIVEYTEYPNSQSKNQVVLSSTLKKITGTITRLTEGLSNIDTNLAQKQTYINEIRSDVDTNSARIKNTYTKDEINTIEESIIQQTSTSITQAVSKVEETIDKVKDEVDAIEIGGRNLLLKSDVVYTNANYPISKYYFGNIKPIDGEKYIIQVKGQLGTGKTMFSIFNSGEAVNCVDLLPSNQKDGIYTSAPFTWNVGNSDNSHISVYPMVRSTSVTSTIQWIKLESGSKATDYMKAPEDIDKDIADIEIGGRNLFKGYGEEEIRLPDYNGAGGYKAFANLTFDPSDCVGQKFTVSFYAKSPNGESTIRVYNTNSTPRYFYFDNIFSNPLTSEWQYYKYTFTNTDRGSTYTPSNKIEFHALSKTGVLIKKIKVEKGNRSTDWTPATEDVQTQIDESISKLNDLANDSKLTPNEKTSTKKEWLIIADEYPKYSAQANTYSIDMSIYTTVYNSLNSYLNTTNTGILFDMISTSNIVQADYINYFKLYYNEKVDLMNAIELAKSKYEVSILEKRVDSAEQQITPEQIINTVSSQYYKKDEADNMYSTHEELKSEVKQLNDSIEMTLKEMSGFNFILNSSGWNSTNFWYGTKNANGSTTAVSGKIEGIKNNDTTDNTVSGSAFYFESGSMRQDIRLTPGNKYTISCKMKKYMSACYFKLIQNGIATKLFDFTATFTDENWHHYSSTFECVASTVTIELSSSAKSMTIADIMLNDGEIEKTWTSNNDEIYTAGVKIDKSGIRISQSDTGTETIIDSSEFAIVDKKTDQKVVRVNGDTTVLKKLQVESDFAVGSVKMIVRTNGLDFALVKE